MVALLHDPRDLLEATVHHLTSYCFWRCHKSRCVVWRTSLLWRSTPKSSLLPFTALQSEKPC